MVWDGLRPDFVTAERTPNLFEMANEGVRFARHHSVYSTITMVDAATIPTGEPPGSTTILGDEVSLVPRCARTRSLRRPANHGLISRSTWKTRPCSQRLTGRISSTARCSVPNRSGSRSGRAGGYVAIVGKKGPTYTFDDSVTGDPAMGGPIAANNFIFVSDDLVAPPSLKSELQPAPARSANESVTYGMRDTYFAQIVTGRALPEAKAAALGGHPALVVFWQHNPDMTQHHRGLGTQANLDALKISDANLASIRYAIAKLGIADRTDLMVVSDHGFATIRAIVPLAQLLVARGLKNPQPATTLR